MTMASRCLNSVGERTGRGEMYNSEIAKRMKNMREVVSGAMVFQLVHCGLYEGVLGMRGWEWGCGRYVRARRR